MSDENPESAGPTTGTETAPETATVETTQDDGAGTETTAKAPKIEGDFDPDRAKALIEKLRGESKAEKAARAAAEKAKADAEAEATKRLDAIARMLGYLPDDGPPDPEKLATQLGKAQEEQRQARIELAVYRAAGKAGADPDAVLDSRAFQRAVNGLDPTSASFTADVGVALAEAVEANPRLKAQVEAPKPVEKPKAGVSGGEITGGTGARPITEAQLSRMSPEEIEKAFKDGRLKHLL